MHYILSQYWQYHYQDVQLNPYKYLLLYHTGKTGQFDHLIPE